MKLVLERAIPPLSPADRLSILKEIPETISLTEYEDLIPKLNSMKKETPSDRGEDDWSNKYITPTEDTKQEIDPSLFTQWYNERILSFEFFGCLENALQLCKHAYEVENFEGFSSLYKMLYLQSLLNKISEQDFTLNQLKEMSEEEILELILMFKADCNQDDIDKRIERILFPALELINQSKEHLKNNLIKRLQNNFDIYPIIRSLKVKMIYPSNEFDQLIKELILHVNSSHQMSICQQLLTLMKDKQDLEYIIE